VTFDRLDDELARWAERGREATLWWRDDDAVAMTPALAPLLELARAHEVPVALAVVPASLDASLVAAVATAPTCTIVQHGYAHRNHAPAGAKSCELGGDRPLAAVVAELGTGLDRLRADFGARFEPVLVPPWNRIDARVVAVLPAHDFAGLSTFGPRTGRDAAPGLACCNAHADPIAWRAGRRFVGAERALDAVLEHLAQRRQGAVDPDEPTGLLTHHLVFDVEAWRFVGELLARTRRHPAARWVGVAEAVRRQAAADRYLRPTSMKRR
jgi:hypothetical protein